MTSFGLFAGIYALSVIIALLMASLNLLYVIVPALASLQMLTTGHNSILYMRITPKSGAGLHKTLLRTVLHAPQSFFDQTDSGVTLNRFSQDMTLIDGSLPSAAVIFLSSKPSNPNLNLLDC